MITGYKFTAAGRDIFYVTLSCFNEEEHVDGYSTTDCIVEKIENANTGEIVQEVNGEAYFSFTYRTGERITGQKIYYCHSIQELFDLVHIEKVHGRVRNKTIFGNIRYFYQCNERILSEWRENLSEYMEKKLVYSQQCEEINKRIKGRMTEYAKKRGWI